MDAHMVFGVSWTTALIGLAWCIWGIKRNAKTGRERLAIIEYIFSQPNWPELLSRFDEVEYKDHARANEWMRDLKGLYHPSLHPAFDAVPK